MHTLAHWPTFIKTAVNYIRETYPTSQFHTDTHVKVNERTYIILFKSKNLIIKFYMYIIRD